MTTDYHKKYNDEHKDRLSAMKKDRYRNDPSYREAAIQRAAKQRAVKRKLLGGPGRVYRVNSKGLRIVCTRIGRVAENLGVPWRYLDSLERRKLIPPSNYGKYRVYDDHQVRLIELLVKCLKSNGGRSKAPEVLKTSKRVCKDWCKVYGEE